MLRRSRIRRRSERGFSLIVVFMLIVVMVGVAAGVAITTQQDLSVTGQDRESQLAFYAAEYAAAQAKDFLTNPAAYPGLPATAGYDNSGTTGWSHLLQSGAPELCQPCAPGATAGTFTCACPPVPAASTQAKPQPVAPPCAPGPRRPPPPQAVGGKANLTELDLPGTGTAVTRVWWQYCVHNDWGDADYVDTTCATYPNGDTNDTCDTPTHQLVIEADGYGPNGATAHLTITVGKPLLQTPNNNTGYGNEGENAAHTGNTGATETGSLDTSQAKGI